MTADDQQIRDELQAVLQARQLLEQLTPLRRDCGRICGAACCQADEDGQGGMLLLPMEDRLYTSLPSGMRLQRDDAVLPDMKLLVCDGTCDRTQRPYACRVFPLTPVLETRDEKERLRVIVDPRAYAVCPLCEYGMNGMDTGFAQAVLESARILCRHETYREYFRALGRYFSRLRTWEEEDG